MRIYHLVILCLISLTVFSEPTCKVTFHDDLSYMSASVRRALQDKDGMMWFATDNGVNRYDGYQFNNFKSKENNGDKMPSDQINHLYLSARGGLWCKIGDRAYLFDTRTYRYVDVMASFEKRIGHSVEVKKIRSLNNGFTWLICKDGSCIRIDDNRPATSAAAVIPPIGNTDAKIATDEDGNSLIMTTKGTYIECRNHLFFIPIHLKQMVSVGTNYYLLSAAGRLFCYNRHQNKVVNFRYVDFPMDIIDMRMVNKTKLVANSDHSLHLYDILTNRTLTFVFKEEIGDVNIDKNNHIWVICEHRVTEYDQSGKMLFSFQTEIPLHNCYMHEDRYHNVWFINNQGIIQYIDKNRRGITEYPQSEEYDLKDGNFISDNQDNVWLLNNSGVFQLSFHEKTYQTMLQDEHAQVRCTFTDSKHRYWISTREDQCLRIYSANNQLIGFLGSDGRIHTERTSLGASLFCMYQTSPNTLWLGTKPDGLFRLKELADGTFSISHFTTDSHNKYSINCNNIYDMKSDHQGRLWIATLGGGLNCVINPEAPKISFINTNNILNGYSKEYDLNLLAILITHNNILLASSNEGLMVGDANTKDLRKMVFRRHKRDLDRVTSLSSSCISGMLETHHHQIFICTEADGINQLISKNMTGDVLDFRHYNMSDGLPTDIFQNIVESGHTLWITSTNRLIEMHIDKDTIYSNSHLQNEHALFSQATPCQLPDGRWLFGLQNGAIAVNLNKLKDLTFIPSIILTGISVMGGETNYNVNSQDTLILNSDQRSLTIYFSALDYNNTQQISYAFKMSPKDNGWNYIKDGRSISFANLNPGTYKLMIRSTNGNGIWVDNTRILTLIVKPKFSETIFARLLILVSIIVMVFVVVHTWLYIRKIKDEQRKTMNAYLALINKKDDAAELTHRLEDTKNKLNPEDQAFMNRIMEFINAHIADSDVNMDDMAMAAATSRSGLNRKIKRIFGVTPVIFLRTARIHRSSDMLRDKNLAINEIAFSCGFSDPKYFSKCFKSIYGSTPAEYRQMFPD